MESTGVFADKEVTIGESFDGKHINFFPCICLSCGWGGWTPNIDLDPEFHPVFAVKKAFCPDCGSEWVTKNEPFFDPKGKPWPILDALKDERETRLAHLFGK